MGLGVSRKYLRFGYSILVGFGAITVNTLLLKLAPYFNVQAEGGGLLKLVLQSGRPFTGHFAFLHTVFFGLLFHYLTGLAMVLFYVYWFSKQINCNAWLKGAFFSLIPWLINGFVVLPLLGLGWLGNNQLTRSGIVYFFAANLIFGVLLGALHQLKFKY